MPDQQRMVSPPRVEQFTVRRGSLAFLAACTGPVAAEPVVLLHGFPGSAATWRDVAASLAADGVSTVALEQRGYGAGAGPAPVSAYRLTELAADVEALLDQLGAARCHLVGHDWGGMVAWYMAAMRPERCASLTVLSTPHPRAYAAAARRGGQALRSTYALAFQLPLLPEVVLTAGRGHVLRSSLVSSGLDPDTAARYAAHLSERGAMRAALHWYRASFRHPGDAGSVGRITVPTTYVWSTRDAALGRTAAEGTGAHVAGPYRFVVLEGVSHWIPEREPERAAAAIATAVGEASGRATA
jgi:pimeloyl-ACP methyl ester carboxylesterase